MAFGPAAVSWFLLALGATLVSLSITPCMAKELMPGDEGGYISLATTSRLSTKQKTSPYAELLHIGGIRKQLAFLLSLSGCISERSRTSLHSQLHDN